MDCCSTEAVIPNVTCTSPIPAGISLATEWPAATITVSKSKNCGAIPELHFSRCFRERRRPIRFHNLNLIARQSHHPNLPPRTNRTNISTRLLHRHPTGITNHHLRRLRRLHALRLARLHHAHKNPLSIRRHFNPSLFRRRNIQRHHPTLGHTRNHRRPRRWRLHNSGGLFLFRLRSRLRGNNRSRSRDCCRLGLIRVSHVIPQKRKKPSPGQHDH